MQNFKDEHQTLAKIMTKLKKAYMAVNGKVDDYDDEYMDLKQYMVDYRNEMDTMEMFSNQRALTTIDKTGVMTVKQRTQLEKLIESPYFGRIDFVYDGERTADAETFYIGKFSFTEEDGTICIFDWRASVSSMYYDYELGEASYEALNGTVFGELIRKRQLKIVNSELDYVLESSINIHDSILQKELSRAADERMKTIIATIQKEQNAIVRNDLAHTLIIQGAAGSGKTSIALHRIAYLLYKYKDSLSSERVMIVSPNKVFADYISTVLPELGEEPIRESSLGDIAEKILPSKYKFKSLYEQTKQLIEYPNSALAKRVAFKSSLHFFEQLTAFLNNQNIDLLIPKDITIQEIDIDANYMTERFWSYAKEPVSKRIEHVAEDLLAVVKAKRQGEVKLPSKNEIVKRLRKLLRFTDALSLYKAFFEHMGQPDQFIWQKGIFEFADVYPYLYCNAYMEGVDTFDLVNHLVIDEMQDYTPVQYAVIQKLFRCKKTILGDFGQSLNPFAVSSSNGFQVIFPQMEYVELKKSYRSSFEIIEFTKQFLPKNAIEAIERHGEQPTIENYENFTEQTEKIKQYLKQFEVSSYKTCGIVCKTAAQVEELYGALQVEFNVHKLDEHSAKFTEGITLASVQLAKGLEFDVVIVPFVDEASYASDFDKGLLYVACTRAMHQLTLLQLTKKPSPLLLG